MDNIRLDNYSFNNNFRMYRVDEIGSTNDFFKENYQYFSDMDCLVAKRQTKGRGRYNRVWESKDDVIMSILFKKSHKNQIIAPLAIILALKNFGINAGIKWPNDVYIDSKKLAGILIEDEYSSKYECSIVGIGLNMNPHIDFDGAGVLEYAKVSNDKMIDAILNNYEKLLNESWDTIIQQYQEYSIILNRRIKYHDKIYTTKAITDEGYLFATNLNESITIKSDEIDIKGALLD